MNATNLNNSEIDYDVKNNEFKKKLYAINLPKFERQANISHLKTDELNFTTIDNGIILPLRKTDIPALNAIYEGGVCDENFNFIAGHIRHDNGKHNNYEVIRSYEVNEIQNLDEEVVFAGVAFSHFGHFLVESMNRLWWVVNNNRNSIKIAFIKNGSFDVPSVFYELLSLIGIEKDDILFVGNATKFRKVIVPEQSVYFFSKYHKEFTLPFDIILKNINPSNHKKVYLSRTKFKKQDCINEEYFEKFYENMGYKIVYPEQLDIKDQISIISGADEIVSTIGTISHMAIFAKEGTRIVSLLRARSFFPIVQVMINQARKLDYTFVDTTCNFLPSRYSANCYYIGPNASWKIFLKYEYGIELDVDLFEYFNSKDMHIGDYFKQWINTFSSKGQLKKIQKDNFLTTLDNLNIIFADEANGLELPPAITMKDLNIKSNTSSRFIKKIFKFSRYDGSYARNILLKESGLIETVSGKDNKNESFWELKDNELVFMDNNRKLTSRYFCTKERDNGLFLLGYYEPNKEIIFKLEEIKDIELGSVKKTKV